MPVPLPIMPRRLLLLPALALAACGPPEPGTPVAFGDLCRVTNDGARVAVEGYIDAGASIFCSNIGGGPVTCGLDLKETLTDEDGPTVYIPQGGGAGEIEEIPEDWTRSMLRIHASDGSLVAREDRVRVSGRARVTEGEAAVCFVTADLIEKVGAATDA